MLCVLLRGRWQGGIRLMETFAMLVGGNIRPDALLLQLKQKVSQCSPPPPALSKAKRSCPRSLSRCV